MILVIRTDKPEAQLSILNQEGVVICSRTWYAHRKLSDTLLTEIEQLLQSAKLSAAQIQAVAVLQGPGSFTGLRIGVATANAFAYAYNIPAIGFTDQQTLADIASLGVATKGYQRAVIPVYGAPVHITEQRK